MKQTRAQKLYIRLVNMINQDIPSEKGFEWLLNTNKSEHDVYDVLDAVTSFACCVTRHQKMSKESLLKSIELIWDSYEKEDKISYVIASAELNDDNLRKN